MTTKRLIAFIDTLTTGRTITDADLDAVSELRWELEKRLTAGRPRVHESDKARYAYHNARRRAIKKRQAEASSAIDFKG